MGCPPVRKIIHMPKLVDYIHVQADNAWYNSYKFPNQKMLKINLDEPHELAQMIYGLTFPSAVFVSTHNSCGESAGGA